MFSRIRTFVMVSFFALLIWLFAEVESLRQDELSTRITFTADATRHVSVAGEFDGQASVIVKGSNAGIDDLRDTFASGVALPVGVGRVPAEPGQHTVSLLDALQELASVRQAGVRIVEVNPSQVAIRVRAMQVVDLPLRVDLPGIDVEGAAVLSRDKLPIAVPTDLIEKLTQEGRWPLPIVATVAAERLANFHAGVSVDRQADLVLPAELKDDSAITAPTARVNVAFTVRARRDTQQLRIPVQVVLPPNEVGLWSVGVEPGEEIIGVRVDAPQAQIERLAREDRLIAVVSLSSDELTQQVASKPVGFVLLRSGQPMPLPESMTVTPDRPAVQLDIEKLEAPAG